jgi:hypothetical protein
MDSLKDIDMYFVTASPGMTGVREFYKEYGLAKYKNVKVVGRDYEYFFVDFFSVHSMPSLALYGPDKKFVRLFISHATVKDLYDETHKK